MDTLLFSFRTIQSALLAIIICIGLVFFAGCNDSSPILVGFSGQLSGKMSYLGVHGRNGAMLAIEHINSTGGIGGRELKLIAKDDGNTPEKALAADTALADEGVVAIIGHMTSSQTLAVLPYINKKGIILISPTTSTPQLSKKLDNFFRVILENTVHSSELADYAHFALDIQTVVTVSESDNKSFTSSFSEGFSSSFETSGGRTLAHLSYSSSSNNNDWDKIVDKLKKLAPDAVLLSMPTQDAVSLIQRIRHAHLKIRILSSPWAYTDGIIQWGGKDAEGIVYVIDYSPDNPKPNYIRFREAYKNRFGSLPSFASAFAYEAVLALSNGLEKTHGSAQGLAGAIAPSQTIDGVISEFRLNEYGDVERSAFVATIQGGAFKTIEIR